MRIVNRFAILSLCMCETIFAQPRGPEELLIQETAVCGVNVAGGAGTRAFDIANIDAKTVTAVVLTGRDRSVNTNGTAVGGFTAVKLYDAATEPLAAQALEEGRKSSVRSPVPISSPPEVTAVVYSDGTYCGDPAWAARIFERRANMEKVLKAAIRDLSLAQERRTSRAELSSQFRATQLEEERVAEDADEVGCIRSVRGLVLLNLERASRQDGSQLPVEQVIRHEITALRARLAALINHGGKDWQ